MVTKCDINEVENCFEEFKCDANAVGRQKWDTIYTK
jgi:hypothetical protein